MSVRLCVVILGLCTAACSGDPVPTVSKGASGPVSELSALLASDYALVKAGEFVMGSPMTEVGRELDEAQLRVTLTHDFYLGKYEVRQSEFGALMGQNPSIFVRDKVDGDSKGHPVENVSWLDAIGYANALSEKYALTKCYEPDGQVAGGTSIYQCTGFRLPTEAEWEYAVRAGRKDAVYGTLASIAWYETNSGSRTHPVGRKQPNALGVYDMLGNVWEFCHDGYDEYPGGERVNPHNVAVGKGRVVRGADWKSTATTVRMGERHTIGVNEKGSSVGFRLARTAR